MIANHIHDALSQVKNLQELIIEKRRFRGYSGTARIVGGVVALAGAAVMAGDSIPDSPWAHLIGWGVVLVLSSLINRAALAYWFFFDPEAQRELGKLRPVFDTLPVLAVGGIILCRHRRRT